MGIYIPGIFKQNPDLLCESVVWVLFQYSRCSFAFHSILYGLPSESKMMLSLINQWSLAFRISFDIPWVGCPDHGGEDCGSAGHPNREHHQKHQGDPRWGHRHVAWICLCRIWIGDGEHAGADTYPRGAAVGIWGWRQSGARGLCQEHILNYVSFHVCAQEKMIKNSACLSSLKLNITLQDKKTWCRCVKIIFLIICGLNDSCKKWYNVCTVLTYCLCAYSCVIVVFIIHIAKQGGK